MPGRTKSLDEFLLQHLLDPSDAAAYLTACLDEPPDQFMSAIQEVALAQGVANLPRAQVPFVLADIEAILQQLGFKFTVQPTI